MNSKIRDSFQFKIQYLTKCGWSKNTSGGFVGPNGQIISITQIKRMTLEQLKASLE